MIDTLLLAWVLQQPAKPRPVPPAVKAAWCYAFHTEPRLWRPYVAYMREWCR